MVVRRSAPAQDSFRNNFDAPTRTASPDFSQVPLPYNFKLGDFKTRLRPSLSLSYNDNINTSRYQPQTDFIITPMLQGEASYPLSRRNLLSLEAGLGYQEYLDHPELSTWQVTSGSQLSLDAWVKDVQFNVHERVSYMKDSALQGAVANTAGFGTLNNAAGLSAIWDLEDVLLSAGYDHLNVISGSGEFNAVDHATEQVFTRAGFQVHPKVITGVEASAAFTRYDRNVLNDNNRRRAGAYADFLPGRHFRFQPRFGYSFYQFQQTSRSVQTSDQGSWYAALSLSHQPSDTLTYSITTGHELSLGIQSDLLEIWYVRPNIALSLTPNLRVNLLSTYEHGKQGAGNISGNLQESYDLVAAGPGFSYALMKRLSVGASYRITLRGSQQSTRSYVQNLAMLTLTYLTP